MKEEFIIKVLDKASEIIPMEQVRLLRTIMEDELYNYEIMPITRALVPYNGIPEKLLLFFAAKKLDGASQTTLKSYKASLIRFVQFVRKEVEDITTMDIRAYLSAYSKTGVKNATIATEIWILRSFFGWLETEDYIPKSPMKKIKGIKVEKTIREPLSQEEMELLRDACKTLRERAMLEFFFSTACRLDEICRLNRQDIDWNHERCIVRGKGNVERYVFLNPKAKVHLWKYLESRTDDKEALFVAGKKPYDRLSRRTFQKDISELGKRAGINKNVFCHRMRHTSATTMIENGASIFDVQKILGHSSVDTTLIYAHANIDNIQQSHKKHLN